MPNPDRDTVDVPPAKSFTANFFAPDQQRFDVRVAAATHQGKVRTRNEDHYAAMRRSRSCELLLTNMEEEQLVFPVDKDYALVVADGIGGSAFGEFASRLALQTVFELMGRATSWLMKMTDFNAQEVPQRVQAYLEEIQKTFRQYSESDPDLEGMGTTWTSVHLLAPHAIFVHVGDSRGYLYREGQLHQITRDQTLAQDMIDAGMAPQDVRRFRHILTNSVGGDAKQPEAEVVHIRLQAGDRLLLCTDGLSDLVDEATIAEVLQESQPQAACDQLVAHALEAGGTDNVTVVLGDLIAEDHGSLPGGLDEHSR